MATNQYPNITAGQDLTADLLNSGCPFTVYKTGTTSRTSNIVATDDPDLIQALASGATYTFDVFLSVTGAAVSTGDIRVALNYSGTTSSGTWGGLSFNNVAVTQIASNGQAIGASTSAYGTNGGNFSTIKISGYVVTSSAGNLSVQWAQQTSSVTATNVRVGSWMRIFRAA